MGIRTLDEARDYESKKRKRENEIRLKKSKQGSDLGGSSSSINYLDTVGSNTSNSNSSRSAATNSDIEAQCRALQKEAPDGNLLTQKEIELCCTLEILPKHYLALQSTIVRLS